MKFIQKTLVAVAVAAVAVTGLVFAPKARADMQWSAEVIASSALVRFEVQPTHYDAASNKYQYKFAWLMPARRTYSFMIDGKMYMSNVKQNGVVETPLWFSPDVTYTIQIFPSGNGSGAVVATGTFRAPSVAAIAPNPQQPEPLSAAEEGEIVAEYITQAPALPKKTVTSKEDVALITALINDTADIMTINELTGYLSAQSREMFAKTPIFVKELDENVGGGVRYKDHKIKVYNGKMYASYTYKFKYDGSSKYEKGEVVFMKENGVWKYDFIQTLKKQFSE